MLNDASGFQKIYLATGYTDLRRGMEGLANIIRFRFHLDPYDRNTLFLFCGKRTYRIKGLLLEEDGFLLLYKRLDTGAINSQTANFWKNCSLGHQRFRKVFENKIYIRLQKRLKIVKVLAMVRLH